MSKAADFAGDQLSWFMIQTGNRIVIMAIGFTPIQDGIGPRIIRGALRLFTTGGGFIIRASVGVGGRIPLGRRRG